MKVPKPKRPPRARYRYALRIATPVSGFVYLGPKGWSACRLTARRMTWTQLRKVLNRQSPSQDLQIVRVKR